MLPLRFVHIVVIQLDCPFYGLRDQRTLVGDLKTLETHKHSGYIFVFSDVVVVGTLTGIRSGAA